MLYFPHMKILLAAGIFPPDIGGPATYAQMLDDELPKAGIDVTVVPYGLVRSLPKAIRHLAYMRLLWKAAADCSVIYALDPMSVGVPARIVAFVRRKHFVVRLGGDYAWEQGVQRYGIKYTLDAYTNHQSPRPLPVRFMAWLQTRVVRGARVVVVPSNYMQGIVSSWGIKKETIRVIYSALHPLAPMDDRQILRDDFLFTGLVISSVARLTPWKGMNTLIDLVAERKKRGDIVTLVIGGDGPERKALEAQVKTHGIEEQVRFVGALTRDAMAAVVYASDIFILNTAYEGLSHQLLEVMDIGTPIITTNIGGNPELITDGVEGLLVPVNDSQAIDAALTKIQTNATLREQLVATAKNRVTFFKSNTVIEEMAMLFKSLI